MREITVYEPNRYVSNFTRANISTRADSEGLEMEGFKLSWPQWFAENKSPDFNRVPSRVRDLWRRYKEQVVVFYVFGDAQAHYEGLALAALEGVGE